MTQSDVDDEAVVLVDSGEWLEEWAWVQVTDEIDTALRAIQHLEAVFPYEDRIEDDDERYHCGGETKWLRPVEEDSESAQHWTPAESDDEKALQFWLVQVVVVD